MKVANLKDVAPERQKLDEPVAIVLETKEELLFARAAFSRSIHHPDVLEDSREQDFNAEISYKLDMEIARRGGHPQ